MNKSEEVIDKKDLSEKAHPNDLERQIKILKARKEHNDADAQLFNSKLINDFGKVFVNIFFCKIKDSVLPHCIREKLGEYHITYLWITLYAILYYCLPSFVVIIDKIGLFLIIFVLGKFLKDVLGHLVHNRNNNTKSP